MDIILASASPYRKALMDRLQIPFQTFNANINEDLPIADHTEYVETLSIEKATAAQLAHPDAICIGCDTIAALGDKRLGKPGNKANATQQLEFMSNQLVTFYSGIAVLSQAKSLRLTRTVLTKVRFRTLTKQMIQCYLEKVAPFNSCGSFQSETLGGALIRQCHSDDPTAIIGLPLIALCDMLETAGVNIFEF